LRIADESCQKIGPCSLDEEEYQRGSDGEEGQTVVEHHADVLVVLLAVAPSHQDLCARTKT